MARLITTVQHVAEIATEPNGTSLGTIVDGILFDHLQRNEHPRKIELRLSADDMRNVRAPDNRPAKSR